MQIDTSARPIVGRESELEQLEAALDALANDESACVAVEGEPGIGKTRLLAELRDRAEERGYLVLVGVGDRVRARPAVQRLGGRARRVRRLAGAEPDTTRGTPRPSASWRDVLPVAAAPGRPGRRIGRGRALPRAPRGAEAARAACRRPAARARARRPPLERRRLDRAARARCCAAGRTRAVLLALAFRRGQAPTRLSAALGGAGRCRRIALDAAQRGRGGAAAGRTLDAQSAAAIYRHGGGNPFYLEQLARAGGGTTLDRAGDRRRRSTRPASRGPSRRRSPTSWRRCTAPSARCSKRRPSPASRSSPTSPRRSPSCRPADGLAALDASARARSPPPDRGAAAVRLPPSARAPSRLRVDARAAGGSRRTRVRRRRSQPGAPRPRERAHHVEQSADQGDEDAIAAPARRPARNGGARAGGGGALVRGGAAAAARGGRRAAGRRPRRARLGPARRSASSSSCRATLLEAIELLPAEPRERRVELTALCAAVEHWLGRHDEAHQRLTARVGRAARPHRRRPRPSADRAGGRRPLRARLRADARDGPRRAGDGARRSATAR